VPFTASHPAAVLPLVGTRLPASALVIGSMVPDLPYFLPPVSGPTHSPLGIVTVDLVLGGAAWLVWHRLLAAPALAAAPRRLRGRIGPGPRRVRFPPAVAAALVIGSATHVAWDEFTHVDRWGTRHVPALAREWYGLAGYRWAQYASTVLGALAIVLWLRAWWRRTPEEAEPPGRVSPRWWLVPGVAGLAGAAMGAAGAESVREGAFRIAVYGARGAAVAGLVLATAWHLRARSPFRSRSRGR